MTNLHHPRPLPDDESILALARQVHETEAAAVNALRGRLGRPFLDAVAAIFASRGRVVMIRKPEDLPVISWNMMHPRGKGTASSVSG